MKAYETYQPMGRGYPSILALLKRGVETYGSGNLMTLLLALTAMVLSGWVWFNNDDVVAWGLSVGLVQEASTRTLPGIVQDAAFIGAVVSVMVIAMTVPYVRLTTAKTARYSSMVVSVGVKAIGTAIHVAGQAVELIVRTATMSWRVTRKILALMAYYLLLGATAIIGGLVHPLRATWKVVVPVLRQLVRAVSAGFSLVALVIDLVGRGLSILLDYLQMGIDAVEAGLNWAGRVTGAGVKLLITVLRVFVTVVVQTTVAVTFLFWIAASVVLKFFGMGLNAVVHLSRVAIHAIGIGIAAGFGYVAAGVRVVAHLVVMGARVITAKMTIVLGYLRVTGRVTSRILARIALTVVVGARIGLTYLRSGISMVSAVTILTVRIVIRQVLAGTAILLQLTAAGVRILWSGITVVLGVISQGMAIVTPIVVALAQALWMGVLTIVGFVRRSAVTVARAVTLVALVCWTVAAWTTRTAWLGLIVIATISKVLSVYLWRGTTYVTRHLSVIAIVLGREIAVLLRMLWTTVTTAATYFGVGIGVLSHRTASAMRFAYGRTLAGVRIVKSPTETIARAGRSGVVAILWLVALTIAIVAPVIGAALVAAWAAIRNLLGFLWVGITISGRVLASLARIAWAAISVVGPIIAWLAEIAWRGLTAASRLTWAGTIVVAEIGAGVLTQLGHRLAVIGRYLGIGVTIIARLLNIVLLLVWKGLATAITYLIRGVYLVAKGLYLPLIATFKGLAAVLVTTWSGVSMVLRPVLIAALSVARILILGVTTAGLVLATITRYLGTGLLMVLQGLVMTSRLAVRTVSNALDVSHDVWRWSMWAVGLKKGDFSMSDVNFNRERLMSLVVTVVVFFTIGSGAVRLVWPAPPEPTVKVAHWATGHLFRNDMLPEMAAEFNKAGHRASNGERIVVTVHNYPSSMQADELLARVTTGVSSNAECCPALDKPHPDPAIVTPSSPHWLIRVNHEAGRKVVNPDAARSMALAYIGILTYREMAQCLGWPHKEIGYADIIELRADPRGWGKYEDCAQPSWGKRPLVAFTDPKTSSTGRSVLLALYAMGADKLPQDLTLHDVHDPAVVEYVKEFQNLIDHYFIGTTVMNTKIYQGPQFGQFFIMPEDNLIHLYEGTERAYFNGVRDTAPPIEPSSMVMIYPKEGSMARNNCACIVDASWVTPEHVEGAEKWIDFIREDEQQQMFMTAGFRPVTDVAMTPPYTKITGRYGLNPRTLSATMNVGLIEPAVANAIDESWEDVKRPGIVSFVVDTSGSMMGGKLQQSKDGLIRALDSMASNNQVGFVSFSDEIDNQVPVGPLGTTGFAIAEKVHKLKAGGETALYDAVKAGVEMVAAAEGGEQAIRGVVVLTDGRANRCNTKLDDLIHMESTNERPIVRFRGCENDPQAVDDRSVYVPIEDIIGRELKLDTDNKNIQIFFIGIGDDADMQVGRLLAGATGAEFQAVAEDDLATVLEEFSGYF